MKRSLLLLLALLFFAATPADAQLIKHWGIFGGVTSSEHEINEDNLYYGDLRQNTGFQIGGFAEWLELSGVSILTQLSYVRKGAGLEFLQTSYDHPLGELVTRHLSLDYLSFAAMWKIGLFDHVIRPYVVAGPRVDILVGRDKDLEVPLNFIHEEFADVIWGLTIGGGIQSRRIASFLIFVEVRYNIDLKNSYDRTWCDPIDCSSFRPMVFKNKSFDVSVGVGF